MRKACMYSYGPENCDIKKIVKKYTLMLTIHTEVNCACAIRFRFKISTQISVSSLYINTPTEISDWHKPAMTTFTPV
jgi:hypothetical protein